LHRFGQLLRVPAALHCCNAAASNLSPAYPADFMAKTTARIAAATIRRNRATGTPRTGGTFANRGDRDFMRS
jgi:hypothetical protein